MLIRFEASNFRSILEPVELSMVAVDSDRPETRAVSNLGESLLTVAAIFGPNASGKSNLIAALGWVRNAVQSSLRSWDDKIPIEPFAFDVGRDRSTNFTVELTIGGVRFEYLLSLDNVSVGYEGLFHYPEKRRRVVFEREGTQLKLQRGLGGLSGTRELLTDRTLVLSIARRFGEPLVSDFARELLRAQTLGPASNHFGPPRSTLSWFDTRDPNQPSLFAPGEIDDPIEENRSRALAMLRLADLGVDDVEIDKSEETLLDTRRMRVISKLHLVHRANDEKVALDFQDESEGTQTWFGLIGPVLTALRDGTLLLFDELDASLHPTLSAQLIGLFHDPATNPKGAQMVFTSHDTSLLNHLNRDEVWLTEKLENGSTRLGALAEFAGERVRKSENLERAYLHGRFGAIPEVNRTELLRALGLIG